MNTYTKIIIVAIVLLATLLVRKLTGVKPISGKALDKFYETHAVKVLSSVQKRYLAYGAIYSITNSNEILAIRPVLGLQEDLKSIESQWGVVDNATAMQVLHNLLTRSRTQEFDERIHQNNIDLKEIHEAIAVQLQMDVNKVRQIKSTYAWDVCRAVNMAKRFYCCDLITAQYMWTTMEQVVSIAQQMGNSWEDYTVSFLIGRSMHGFGLDDISSECRQLLQATEPSGNIKDIDVYRKYAFK